MKNQSILFLAILFVGLASSCSRKESLNFNKANNYGVSQSSSSCSSKAKKECTGTKTTEEVVVPVEETPANAQADTANEAIIALTDVEIISTDTISVATNDEIIAALDITLSEEFVEEIKNDSNNNKKGSINFNKTNNYSKSNNYGGGSKKEEAVLLVTEEVTAPEEDTDSEKKPSDE
jgi:hypothetical protein